MQQKDFTKLKKEYFPILVTYFKNYFPVSSDAFKKTKRGYC